MRAVVLKGFGGPEMLAVEDVERPSPAHGQLLIRVAATSVNRPDIVQREGNYPPPPGESEILGLEVAGVVERVGGGVDRFRAGDRVLALIGGGGYAEYAVAHSRHAMPIPDALSFEQAACICETYVTAYLNVFLLGGFEDRRDALIHGGGGGVATAAIQLCKALAPAARLIVTASSGKVERVRQQGADEVIDYRTLEFATEVARVTNRRGVDLILDHIGARYLEANLKSLAVGGVLMLIGVMGGGEARVNLARLMVKRQRIVGSVLRSRAVDEKASIIASFEKAVMPLFAGRRIVPLIHATFPLEGAADAHRLMESGGHFGKIVLVT